MQCPNRTPAHHCTDQGLLLLASPDWRARRWLDNHARHIHRERGIGNSVHVESDLIFFSSRFAPSGCLAISLDHHHTLCRHLPSSGGREGSLTPAGARLTIRNLILGGWVVEVDDEGTIGQRSVLSKKKSNLHKRNRERIPTGRRPCIMVTEAAPSGFSTHQTQTCRPSEDRDAGVGVQVPNRRRASTKEPFLLRM